MSLFWNERYSSEGFAYGTEPNQFLKNQLQHLNPGKMLLPGEGEGRNAVYAAQLGWNVHAIDSSSVAAKKAVELSNSRNVMIQYTVTDINEIVYSENHFDCIAIIFLHLPPETRVSFHTRMLGFLKPGGTLLLEAFSKQQLKKNTGGPNNFNMLYSKEELHADFSSASKFVIEEAEVKLNEGTYHQGVASLVRVIAKK